MQKMGGMAMAMTQACVTGLLPKGAAPPATATGAGSGFKPGTVAAEGRLAPIRRWPIPAERKRPKAQGRCGG